MNENETVREVCAEMRGMGNYQSYSGDHARELANRIEIAYEREMAAKDEMNRIVAQSAQARFIARLNAALNPVLECRYASCDVFQERRCADAIREAQRIYNEGGAK